MSVFVLFGDRQGKPKRGGISHRFAMVTRVLLLSIANFGRGWVQLSCTWLWALRVVIGPSGRKGAFESPSLIRKRNQTNQLQTKLLTSGPGGRRFKSSLPDQSFQAHK